MNPMWQDYVVVAIANLINLLLTIIFIARRKQAIRVEYFAGLITISLGIPLSIVALLNIAQAREWWTFSLSIPMILFCVVEYLFDYIYKLPFRENWLMGPYMLIFYLGLFGMIGYSFLVTEWLGYGTLSTYFAQLFASWYGHSGARK